MNLAGLFDRALKNFSAEDLVRLGEELHAAADRGDLDAVKKLHASGAEINYSHVNLGTALIASAGENHAPVVDYLLKNQANVSLCNMFDQTALHMAIRQNDDDKVALKLIAASAPLNGRDKHGKTPSFYAAQNAKAGVLKALADKDADFRIASNDGTTPLMQATAAGHIDAIHALTLFPCALDAQDAQGRTALMLAAMARDEGLVEKYLSLGADFDLRDNNGRTAADIAKQLPDCAKVLELLERASATRVTPFHTGTENKVTIMKRLVLKGASV